MHPNDTLNGKLLEFERPEEKHLRSALGYWRMVEERMIRDQLVAEGHDRNDYFGMRKAILARVEQNHAHDVTYAETSRQRRLRHGRIDLGAEALANRWGEACQRQQEAGLEQMMEQDAFPRFLDALRRIAAGHNDARGLAREALGEFFSEED